MSDVTDVRLSEGVPQAAGAGGKLRLEGEGGTGRRLCGFERDLIHSERVHSPHELDGVCDNVRDDSAGFLRPRGGGGG